MTQQKLYEKVFERHNGRISVCIIGIHNRYGEIDHYIIQKKKNGFFHKRKTVKILDKYRERENLRFKTRDEALQWLEYKPIDETEVFDEYDFIC